MAQSQNNVKVLPGWSTMGVRDTYPVNRKDHYHLKVVEQGGGGGGGGDKLYKVKLLLVKN